MDLGKQVENTIKKHRPKEACYIKGCLVRIVRDPLLWLRLVAERDGDLVVTCTKRLGEHIGDDAVHRKALELRLKLLDRTLSANDVDLTRVLIPVAKTSESEEQKRKSLFANYLNSSIFTSVDADSHHSNPCGSSFNTISAGVITELHVTDKGWVGYVTSYPSNDQHTAMGYQFDSTSPMEVDSQLGAYPIHIGDEVSFISDLQSVASGTLQVTKYNTCIKDDFVVRYFEWILSSENTPLECITKLSDWPVPWVCVLAKEKTYRHFCDQAFAVCNLCAVVPELALAPKEMRLNALAIIANSHFLQNIACLLDPHLVTAGEESLCIAVKLLCSLVIAKVDQCLLAKPLRDMTHLLERKNRADLLKPLMLSLLDSSHCTSTVSSMTTIQAMWRSVPTIPSNEELQAIVKCFEESKTPRFDLPVVKSTYASEMEYGHTYFSLLRADCYYPLCEKIAHFKTGKEKEVSKDCYKMALTDIVSAVPRPVLLGFRFESLHQTDQEDDSPYLKKGNLLCISKDGMFDGDVIWATITSTQGVTYEKQSGCSGVIKGIVHIQLCSDFNALPDEECMEQLRMSNNVLAVESPAYFRAYQPVLDALKELDLSRVHFLNTLLNPAGYSLSKSDLLTSDISPDALFKSDVGGDRLGRSSAHQLLTHLRNDDLQSLCLDPSQVKAVCQSLEYPISVIQGPPGTGKTYVGVKLMQLFLSLSSLPKDKPILIMAHKNRALDHYLDKCLTFCSGIVRIGRCSEGYERLQCFLLHRQCSESERERELKRHLELLSQRISEAGIELNVKRKLTFENCKEYLTTPWLQSLLLHDPQQQLSEGTVRRLQHEPEECAKLLLKHGATATASGSPTEAELRDALAHSWASWTKSIPSDFHEQGTNSNPEGGAGVDALDAADDSHDWMEDERRVFDTGTNLDTANAFKVHIDSVTGAHEERVVEDNVWSLTIAQRSMLIRKAVHKGSEPTYADLRNCLRKYDEIRKKYEFEQRKSQLRVLQCARIVGMTTTGAAIHQQLLNQLKAEVVFVEEAAEVLESNLLAALTPHVKHLILIGDHMQLKPWVAYSGSKKLHFDKSLFQRLIENGKDFHYTMLGMQSRMRPEFLNLFSNHYSTREAEQRIVSNDEIVGSYKPLSCMATSLFWWSHTGEENKLGTGWVNELEVKMVVSLCLWILSRRVLEQEEMDLVILTPYRAQVTAISDSLRSKNNVLLQTKSSLAVAADLSKLKVYTVDGFQGHEASIVILSLVRGNKRNQVGFLKDKCRQVVALSRQRCGLYIIGHMEFLQKASPSVWKPIIEICKKERNVSIGSSIVIKAGPEATYQCSTPEELEKHVMHYRFNAPGRQQSCPATFDGAPSTTPHAETCLNMIVEDACLRDLARSNVISKWKEIGRCIGVEDFIITKVDHSQEPLDEKFYQLMYEWKKHTKEATYETLIEALNSCGFENVVCDVVTKYACTKK